MSGRGRQQGRIEERGNTLRVIVYAGIDPVTGRRSYLREKVDGTDKAAWRDARKVRNRLLNQANEQRTPSSGVTLGHTVDEYLRTAELEDGTREMYRGYLERNIRPVLGSTPIKKITPRILETFYAELRRCRKRCNGSKFVEHVTGCEENCKTAGCEVHTCTPLASSTVRQIHAVISGALSAAVRWGWLNANPAKVVQRPKQKPPDPDPPSPAEAAKLIEAAFKVDDDWGTLVHRVGDPQDQLYPGPRPTATTSPGPPSCATKRTPCSLPTSSTPAP